MQLRCAGVIACVGLAGCGGGLGVPDDDGGAAAPDAAAPVETTERLYVGTGEYDGVADWHGILRFDGAEALDARVDPDATIPVKQTVDGDGVALNFAHGMYLREATDELWVSTLFTNPDNVECRPCMPSQRSGSIAVLAGASTATGPQTVARHVIGDATRIFQPHGLWIDEARDELYVANTFAGEILVFADASTLDGDVAPARVIRHPRLGRPVFVHLDAEHDRLFVSSMADGGPQSNRPAILVFDEASTRDGETAPDVRIVGDATRLGAGNNQTTHNVWFDPARALLFVGHHTNELLIFDLDDVELSPSAPVDLDLAPRVVETQPAGSAPGATSVYGLFYLSDIDRLYVATGNVSPDSAVNAVRVWDGVSDSAVAGATPPSRVIAWPTTTYWPPQPIWVERVPR